MLAAARCDSNVLLQYGCAIFWRHGHESHTNRASVMDDGVPVRSFDVVNPVGDRTEHRDDVLLTGHRGEHDSICTHPARRPIADFQRHPGPGCHAKASPPTEQLAYPMTKPSRAAVAVEQTIERIALRRIGHSAKGSIASSMMPQCSSVGLTDWR